MSSILLFSVVRIYQVSPRHASYKHEANLLEGAAHHDFGIGWIEVGCGSVKYIKFGLETTLVSTLRLD